MNIIKHMSKGRVVVSAVILILAAVIMFCILKPAVGEDVDFLYGCKITPCVRYENTLYYYAPSGKEGKAKLTGEWSPTATIKSASSDLEAALEELQGNYEK